KIIVIGGRVDTGAEIGIKVAVEVDTETKNLIIYDIDVTLPGPWANKLGKHYEGLLSSLSNGQENTDHFIDIVGSLERISNTPIPLAYRQVVTSYVWLLPVSLVDILGWLTIPVIFVISFILFGVEAIGE
ncbi:1626_t:CDS:2, partial [Cetraspora pellucida]